MGVALLAAGCDGDALPTPRSIEVVGPRRVETPEPCALRVLAGGTTVTSIEEIHYDPWLRRVGRRVSDYTGGEGNYREQWAYDSLDRLVVYAFSDTNRGGAVNGPLYERHTYDAAGDRVRTLIDYGRPSLEPVVITRVFDAGRPVQIERRTGEVLERRQTFTYDGAGRVVERRELDAGGARAWQMAYDAAGRLVERIATAEGVAVSERWAYADDGALVEATLDRDGDGRVDFRERRVAVAGGHDRTFDEGDDGQVERRVSTRVEGARETVTTDLGDDGVADRVVVTVREADRVWVATDEDGDGAVETIVETIDRGRETEVRTDFEGDGVFDVFETTRLTAEGELEWRRRLDAAGEELVSDVINRRDGRLVGETLTVAGKVVSRVEYLYQCGYNPFPPTTPRPAHASGG